MALITVAMQRFPSYKYLHRLALIIISHFFLPSSLRVYSSYSRLTSMEDKRGTKCSHSPSAEGSPPRSVPTPPPTPTGSPSPLRSPPEVSYRRPRSPMFQHAGPSRQVPVVDLSLSLDEECPITDTLWDAEFAK
jgi:hypothetical protein